jgi:hypothetical protein
MAIATIPTSGFWSDISALLNGNFTEINTAISPAEFDSIARIQTPVTTDGVNPSHILGLEMSNQTPGDFQIEADVGGIRNISGRTLIVSHGLVSTHAKSTNASDRVLYIASQLSPDKVTWTVNADSGRSSTVSGTTEEYGSKSSEAFNWPSNSVLRFVVYASGAGVSLEAVTFNIAGEAVTGPAFRWRLKEETNEIA